MKELTIDLLKEMSNRLLLNMKEEEYFQLFNELKNIEKQFIKLANMKSVDNEKPIYFPYQVYGELREDNCGKCLFQEEILKNSSYAFDNMIKIPK